MSKQIALGTVAAITAQLLRDSENLQSDGDILVYIAQERQYKADPRNRGTELPLAWRYHRNRVRELTELAFLICDQVEAMDKERNDR